MFNSNGSRDASIVSVQQYRVNGMYIQLHQPTKEFSSLADNTVTLSTVIEINTSSSQFKFTEDPPLWRGR